ncbi:ATP-dependent helicase [Nocardioidaceae bacterium]|nr:ATP-dependent helicase [Nocardioidaceae bacterium]
MTTYRLLATAASAATPPPLDQDQRAVVAHTDGPLLVLAGPGTGKTTTLVEAITARLEEGVDPAAVLALTFSRKAATELRDRVTARSARTVATVPSQTFHSFALSLLRRYAPAGLYAGPLRLLTAPEADVVMRELLTGSPVRWPAGLRTALGTRGFAHEVATVISRAREKGMDPYALHDLASRHGASELQAAALFMEEYLTNLDSQGATDYADLVRRAVLEAQTHREELRAEFGHVYVDEYQDTDPGQVALLRAIAGDGRHLVAVGDPHQSIYGFRGAEVRGILDFPEQFPDRAGAQAPVVVLGTTRRFGHNIATATARVAAGIGLRGSIPRAQRERFASPTVLGDGDGDGDRGRVEVLTYDTERAEAEHVADLLRRAHLEHGVPWSRMAVLARSGRGQLPSLRRSLAAAGVPVDVAGDELALGEEPAVAALLTALGVVDLLRNGEEVPVDSAAELLRGPLADLDASDVRRLARALRAQARADGRPPPPSATALRDALVAPDRLDPLVSSGGPDAQVARAFARLAHRLRDTADGLRAGGTAETALWALWDGTGWPERLRRATERPGSTARQAHRDLDAVCALFDSAGRAVDDEGHKSVRAFLDTVRAQQIPAGTLAEADTRDDAVRLLTAHRSKGLEWDLVVVCHVQEEVWPDLRRRATLLQPDRLGVEADGRPRWQPPTTRREALAEERRLFYVACTRARRRLVVTAVASTDDDGEQPSRFLAELGTHVTHRRGRPSRPLALSGLVAELRRVVGDPSRSPALRDAAARRLALLAATRHESGRPVAPHADPAAWWGLREHSRAEQPVRETEAPLRLSASALAALRTCPAKWFLEREAGGASLNSAAQGFGNLVHLLAEQVATGELDVGPEDSEALMEHVDRVWAQIAFRTPWSSTREREAVREVLGRFLRHHHRPDARTTSGVEQAFEVPVELPDGERVVLRGFADRLELDAQGRVWVVDLKTTKRTLTKAELAEDPQLGVYQLAAAHGAFAAPGAGAGEGGVDVGGAELWQLRHAVRGALKVQTMEPQEPDEAGVTTVQQQLMDASRVLRSEEFVARPGGHCDHCPFQTQCPAHTTGTVLS